MKRPLVEVEEEINYRVDTINKLAYRLLALAAEYGDRSYDQGYKDGVADTKEERKDQK